jgi:hypothetical protein
MSGHGSRPASPVEQCLLSGSLSDEPREDHLPRPKSKALKGSYYLARSAPSAGLRILRLRPRLVLQLQQISNTIRPIPILEVVQSTALASCFSRLCLNLFGNQPRLGPCGFVVLRASEVAIRSSSSDVEQSISSWYETGSSPTVVATLRQPCAEGLKGGKIEICSKTPNFWEAKALPNDSYEFVSSDNHSKAVRWIRRDKSAFRTLDGSRGMDGSVDGSKRFTFSVIERGTRRHPVIATITGRSIEVVERYASSIASDRDLPSRSSTASDNSGSTSDAGSVALDRNTIEVTNDLCTLILTTAIWVALQEK